MVPVAGPHPADIEVDAYCRYAVGTAASRSALLASPWLFSSLGTVGIGGTPAASLDTPLDGGDAASRRPRLAFQAGMGFSPTRLYAASLVDDAARADCEIYRADSLVQRLLHAPQPTDRGALEARARVLREALPDARTLLADRQSQLDNGRATLQDYSVTALKVQALQRDLTETEGRLATLQEASGPQAPPARAAFEALRTAEERRQGVDGRLRRSAAFEVTVRGGYQEVIALAGDPPVFGSISAQFVPGWFWQHDADRQAADAQRDRVEARINEVRARLAEVRTRLSGELAVAQKRLSEVTIMLTDLEDRYNGLREVGTRQSRDFREYLWFDLIQLRANRAFVSAQVQALTWELTRVQDDGS
jgi:hypothetical protein